MEDFFEGKGGKFLMKELGLQLELGASNKIRVKPTVFLNYHADKLAVNFVDRGLAHYDTVVRLVLSPSTALGFVWV